MAHKAQQVTQARKVLLDCEDTQVPLEPQARSALPAQLAQLDYKATLALLDLWGHLARMAWTVTQELLE